MTVVYKNNLNKIGKIEVLDDFCGYFGPCHVLPRLVVAAGSSRHFFVDHPDKVTARSRQSGTVGWYKDRLWKQ